MDNRAVGLIIAWTPQLHPSFQGLLNNPGLIKWDRVNPGQAVMLPALISHHPVLAVQFFSFLEISGKGTQSQRAAAVPALPAAVGEG